MEKQLLRKLFNNHFFVHHHNIILPEFFPEELGAVYDVICRAHDTYKTDLKTEWVRKLYAEYNPAATVAAKQNIAIILDDIEHEDDVPDDMAHDILTSMHVKEHFRKIANAAVQGANGEETNFTEIRQLLDNVNENDITTPSFEELKFDLKALLSETSNAGMFPFRLSHFRDRVYGAGRGNFIILFARPEAGKTSYAAYETAGYLREGLKVAYFGNEEPINRIYLRTVCSMLEKSTDDIRGNPDQCSADFEQYKDNLHMFDCVGMDIADVDAWAAKHKPDIIFLDQLDKFYIKGQFSRGDERLGELYNYGREIAKRNKCLVWAISQCSADGEGLNSIDYSMLAGSKTAKAGEADLIIGIGKNTQLTDNDEVRQFNISKNKINGWHGHFAVMLDRYKALYYE